MGGVVGRDVGILWVWVLWMFFVQSLFKCLFVFFGYDVVKNGVYCGIEEVEYIQVR